MRHADLFAGMGGMTLALEGVSEPALYCEIDEHAKAHLRHEMDNGRLPAAPIVGDVRDTAAFRQFAPVDIVCAGFPCVGFSAVGSKGGLADERSGLFHAAVSTCVALRAGHLFLENVPEVLNHPDDFKAICRAAADAGLTRIRWTVVSAADVGAPHLRRRWFCLCSKPGGACIDMSGAEPLGDWSGRCPPPVTADEPRNDALIQMLGNSLVPQAARAALAFLLQDAPCRPSVARKSPKHGAYLGGVILETSAPCFPRPADYKIKLDPLHYSDGTLSRRSSAKVKSPELKGAVTRARWPTPRAGPPSHSHILTDRATWDLSSAARFCSEMAGTPMPRTDSTHRLSPAFVMFLMRGLKDGRRNPGIGQHGGPVLEAARRQDGEQ
jgi:DNA (cytosine-5)-methyltransferase 1